MPEKSTPHYDLEATKAAFSTASRLIATTTATRDAAGLGYGSQEIVTIIQTMTTSHFYKSMTSDFNNAWQDVYHVPHTGGTLYVKFTDNGGPDLVLLSFKEK